MSRLALLVAAAGLLVWGCGESERKPRLVVSAASSLAAALTSCSKEFADADVRLQFAGSDELAAQIRRGVTPDVFAAANTKLPYQLHAEGLLEKPATFAANELVLAVPAGSTRVRSLRDVGRSGTKLAIGSASVPVGSYTRELISHLPAAERERMLANVRSEEPDVRGVVGKLTQRAVDAGFVYASDVAAGKERLDSIRLPRKLKPAVAYGAGVVSRSKQNAAAREYVDDLVSGNCAKALRKAGFKPPSS
jgi:molybdate transport system substrate-binding protein